MRETFPKLSARNLLLALGVGVVFFILLVTLLPTEFAGSSLVFALIAGLVVALGFWFFYKRTLPTSNSQEQNSVS